MVFFLLMELCYLQHFFYYLTDLFEILIGIDDLNNRLVLGAQQPFLVLVVNLLQIRERYCCLGIAIAHTHSLETHLWTSSQIDDSKWPLTSCQLLVCSNPSSFRQLRIVIDLLFESQSNKNRIHSNHES